MRIDKVLETHLKLSRKAMKRLLKQRKVTVNHHVVTEGSYNVDGAIDTCEVDGKPIALPCHRYYMLNKPKGVITAHKDETQATIFDLLPCDPTQFHFIGRLDKDTTGLMLVTDNGPLCYALTQKKMGVTKTYDVVVNGLLKDDIVSFFKNGVVFLDGKKCLPADIQIIEASDTESRATVVISEGSRHHIKKLFLSYGVKVTALNWTNIATLSLDQTLNEGSYRLLNQEEIRLLMDQRRLL